jgi:hypothetical protein
MLDDQECSMEETKNALFDGKKDDNSQYELSGVTINDRDAA